MSVIHPGLFLIMHRFPNNKDALRRLYLTSHSFQTLCDDYQKCKGALDHWMSSSHDQAAERSRDYHGLLHDLENEIEELLGVSGE